MFTHKENNTRDLSQHPLLTSRPMDAHATRFQSSIDPESLQVSSSHSRIPEL